MDNIVQELIKIEMTAEMMADESAKKQKTMEEEFFLKKEQLKSAQDEATDKRIREYAEAIESETAERLAAINTDTSKRFADIEVLFNNCCKQWEEEIINRIIRR